MPFAYNGDVRLYYERIGNPSFPTVLLINGAGRQCVDFADEFCAQLAEQDFSVIRYDQRDTGLSSSFTHFRPDAAGVSTALADGRTPVLPYDIAALAADARAVLDACDARRTHLFGRSLGSAVAQVIALDQPQRILSMTLAIALSRGVGGTTPLHRLRAMDAEHLPTEAAFVERQLQVSRAVGNLEYFDADRIRAEASRAFRRGIHAGAIARHFMVGLALADLRPRLQVLKMPVQIIHGGLDRVVPLSYAEETAAAIPGAKLAVLADMAHEAPPPLWGRWIDLFVKNAACARA